MKWFERGLTLFAAVAVVIILTAIIRDEFQEAPRPWGRTVRVISPSLPPGDYRTSIRDSLALGLPTLICLPETVGAMAIRRGYTFKYDICPPHGSAALKMLAALPGDTVTVTQDSIQVNSRPWLPVRMLTEDTRGHPLPDGSGSYILGPEECFALALFSPRSFDSRYYGPVRCPRLPFKVAMPINLQDSLSVDSLRRQLAGI